jgi:prepilin-type N-terminal cleavage/methylation domain-containing protein
VRPKATAGVLPAQRVANTAGSPRSMRLPHGFSLIEMVITLTISTVILMTLYGFMVTQAMVSLDEETELSAQNTIRQGAQQLLDELEVCRPRRLDSMGAWFEYYVPNRITDGSGSLVFGAQIDDTFYPGGFHSIAFVRSNDPQDFLTESDPSTQPPAPGIDLNGNGSTTDVFVGGHLVFSTYDINGNPIGTPRTLNGKFFMELNPLPPTIAAPDTTFNLPDGQENVDSLNTTTFATMGTGDPEVASANGVDRLPYKGTTPIFIMRQINGTGAQRADKYIDNNNDGVFNAGDVFMDTNGNNQYDSADSEPFTDLNENNIRDPLEPFVDANHNNKYDCRMTLQFMTYDTRRSIGHSTQTRDKNFGFRLSRTKIRFKNANT